MIDIDINDIDGSYVSKVFLGSNLKKSCLGINFKINLKISFGLNLKINLKMNLKYFLKVKHPL